MLVRVEKFADSDRTEHQRDETMKTLLVLITAALLSHPAFALDRVRIAASNPNMVVPVVERASDRWSITGFCVIASARH